MIRPGAVKEVLTAPLARRAVALLLAAGLGAFAARSGRAQDEVEITAAATGFRPKVVRLRKGESVRIVLRTADREHCFAVDELRVEKRILPGRDTLLDLTPDRAGSFPFYSCLEPDDQALRGRLIVSE